MTVRRRLTATMAWRSGTAPHSASHSGADHRMTGPVLCSWLGKLETAKRVLVDDAPQMLPSLDALANAFVYLQVSTALLPL